jgi:hypothetical protein
MTKPQIWVAAFLAAFILLFILQKATKKEEAPSRDLSSQMNNQMTEESTTELTAAQLISNFGCTNSWQRVAGTKMAPALKICHSIVSESFLTPGEPNDFMDNRD